MAVVIGFCGTFGSGKGTAIKILTRLYGADHYSTSEELGEECKRRGLPTDRATKTWVANQTREKLGPGIFSQRVVDKIHAKKKGAQIICVDALRTVGEVNVLKRAFGKQFVLVAMDAPIKLRYNRVKQRLRDKHDNSTFRQFSKDEDREVSKATTDWEQNIGAVMRMSQVKLGNEGTEKDLEKKLADLVEKILKTGK